GTGSLILDRPNRIAYACRSPRTDEQLLDTFCERMDYQKIMFTAVDADGKQIYHTNVMMALGETFVVICLDAVPDAGEREALRERFDATGKAIIEISLPQMMQFAGNMLQVANANGDTFLVMSEQAYQSLSEEQLEQIKTHTMPLHSPLDTIERYGGGSARCMMAEIFLKERGA
ncbi:MAG TPA: arginine deiminase-related protein, partial [Phaeodactylibacter sp.]|nr:arginine deiminase-related protein [Phaeodactylibacter sp.]